ncbi:MAG: copper chaperone PCu(A)C [Pseudorhodobacter sp.]|nr:copper chaperone PCu(A)C [Pseudorhodobacter sp.]
MTRTVSLISALLFSTSVFAHEVAVGDLQVIHAHIPAPAASAKSAAGYMAIANDGPEAERLIGVEVDFAHAMLHTTIFSADGIASMTHIEAVEIPAGDAVVLEPGGIHVMLMGLTRSLAVGDMLPATLIFEHAGPVAIEFMVDPADGSMDHSMMDHSTTGN